MMLIFWTAVGYICGSVSSAVIICRIAGLPDPRTEGSGNPGATNVLRLGGRKAAFATLLGDGLKGMVPVVVAYIMGASDTQLAACGLGAFFGHLYPVFFNFKGGKGVATGMGVLFGFSWMVGLLSGLTWIAMAALSRISSLSAIVAFCLAPLYVLLFKQSLVLALATAVITGVLLWRHQPNIRRLIRGEEPKIGKS